MKQEVLPMEVRNCRNCGRLFIMAADEVMIRKMLCINTKKNLERILILISMLEEWSGIRIFMGRLSKKE